MRWTRLPVILMMAGCMLSAYTARSAAAPAEPATGQPTEPTPEVATSGPTPGSIEFHGVARTYSLYVPASLQPGVPVALVVALHGGGGNAANLERTVGLDAIAEREGFLVVYPDGSGRLDEILLTWNAGNCCGYALDEQVDDVGFVRALVEQLSGMYAIDPKQVYATGMSNGGMMSYRLACEAADLFAAVAPVAGALNVADCEPAKPVSVLAIHGTGDQHVLFEGGAPIVKADVHERVDRSVHYAMTFWAAFDGCSLEPQAEQGGTVIHESYSGCQPGLSVELLAVEGGGHAWPGAVKFTAQGDEPSPDLNASEAMWAFFEAHPKP
jgi:polyhydroxybutyrate depolymerase